jgi:phosphate transport system substrate-binding protein
MKYITSLTLSICLFAFPVFARDQIQIVGSSTVFPYTQAVAEQFTNLLGGRSPVVESTGSGGGMQIFCGGIGTTHPDITASSRAIKESETELCAQNGVVDISEALIGYDGLSIAISRDNEYEWDMTLSEIFLALSTNVPVDGEWVANPFQTWDQINPTFPAMDILVYGPPPTSGTRDAFVELAMHVGCKKLDYVIEGGFDNDWVVANCSMMRQDGPFVEAGENDNLIVQRLGADTNAMGIFGYSFLYENMDIIKSIDIDAIAPNMETIGDGSYPISRPLYIYIKNDHRGVIPGLQEFIEEYLSDNAIGAGGYLQDRGLVSLSDEALVELQQRVINP